MQRSSGFWLDFQGFYSQHEVFVPPEMPAFRLTEEEGERESKREEGKEEGRKEKKHVL